MYEKRQSFEHDTKVNLVKKSSKKKNKVNNLQEKAAKIISSIVFSNPFQMIYQRAFFPAVVLKVSVMNSFFMIS